MLVTGGTSQRLDDVAIDDEDRLVAIGFATSGGPLVVATRYSAAGVLDDAYGTGGVQTVPSAAAGAHALLLADGRLLAVGAYPRSGGGYDVALWRFWP